MPHPAHTRRLVLLPRALGLVSAVSLLASCATTPAPDAESTLRRAEQAMGATALKTLMFSARGTGATFGQAWQPSMTWPGLNYSGITRWMDYDNAALREDFGRSRSEPNGGGATPLMGQGEARASGSVRGTLAWNGAGATATAAPVAVEARLHDLWTSPHGVLKAARAHKAQAATASEGGQTYTTLSFAVPGTLSATAWIDAAGMVTRIDSRLPHPVAGDTLSSTTFSGYRDHGGVKFPARIVQTLGRSPVLDLSVTDVQPNAAVDIAVPEAVRNFTERVVASSVAPGVWYLAGGSHHSVLVEMRDHLMVVESPLYDGRAMAVFAQARQLVPGKPIRFVINSHHHFDHAGGLRAAVAEGATLVTSEQAKPYFERVFSNANSIKPDAMARSGRTANIVGVSAKRVFSDGQRVVEVHELQGSVHAQGFLMVYLPTEKLLVQADAYTPAAPNTPPPPVVNANHVNLVQNIERLGLQVERILPLHGRVVPIAELHAAIGRR